jgi:hypothetical protein
MDCIIALYICRIYMAQQAALVNASKGDWQSDKFDHWQGHCGLMQFHHSDNDGCESGEIEDTRSILLVRSR